MITMLVNGVDVGASGVTLNQARLFVPDSTLVHLANQVETRTHKRILITHGSHRMMLTIGSRAAVCDSVVTTLAAAPYQSGERVMIPLHDVVQALHESMRYDAVRHVANVTILPPALVTEFTPAPASHVPPTEVFTPRPQITPAPIVTPVVYPRRTPFPVHLDADQPPL